MGPHSIAQMKPGASYPRSDVWHYILTCVMKNTGLEQWTAVSWKWPRFALLPWVRSLCGLVGTMADNSSC